MQKRIILQAEEALEETLVCVYVQDKHRLQRATKTVVWPMVQQSMVNGTELFAQEWKYFFFLKYGIDPSDLPKICDG